MQLPMDLEFACLLLGQGVQGALWVVAIVLNS